MIKKATFILILMGLVTQSYADAPFEFTNASDHTVQINIEGDAYRAGSEENVGPGNSISGTIVPEARYLRIRDKDNKHLLGYIYDTGVGVYYYENKRHASLNSEAQDYEIAYKFLVYGKDGKQLECAYLGKKGPWRGPYREDGIFVLKYDVIVEYHSPTDIKLIGRLNTKKHPC